MIACILSRDNMTILVFSSLFPQGKELSATLGTQLLLMIERSFNWQTLSKKYVLSVTLKTLMRIQIKLSKCFHPNIHPFSQSVIPKPNQTENQTKQRKKNKIHPTHP